MGEVSETARPVDGALGVVGLAADPGAQLDLHGGLGPGGAVVGLGGRGAADLGAVDLEADVVGGPVDGVGMQALDGVEGDAVGLAVDVVVYAFGEEVGLDVAWLAADPFL